MIHSLLGGMALLCLGPIETFWILILAKGAKTKLASSDAIHIRKLLEIIVDLRSRILVHYLRVFEALRLSIQGR